MTNEILIDAFERIKSVVHRTVDGLDSDGLTFRLNESANSIAWLVWHLTRIQDDHVADLMKVSQVWDKWRDKFALPFDESDTGYGHSPKDVAAVKSNAKLLMDYYDAVHVQTIQYVSTLTDSEYQRVVDKRWNPPVTLAVRLISVISDDLQHAGQAAYVKGLIEK